MSKPEELSWEDVGDTEFTEAENQAWENSDVRVGFELHYQGEEDEAKARKTLLPLLKFLFQMGYRVRNV